MTWNFLNENDREQDFVDLVNKRLSVFFENVNKNVYLKRGMQWYLIKGHYWLELRLFDINWEENEK